MVFTMRGSNSDQRVQCVSTNIAGNSTMKWKSMKDNHENIYWMINNGITD